jgi:hypothetical protein
MDWRAALGSARSCSRQVSIQLVTHDEGSINLEADVVRRLQVHVYTCTAHANSAHDSLLVIASAQKSMRSTPRYMQTEANGSTRPTMLRGTGRGDASSALVANSLLTANTCANTL